MKTALGSTLISLTCYTVCYLFAVVYRFDFFNPFEWVYDVPKWCGGKRIALLLFILSWNITNTVMVHSVRKELDNGALVIGGYMAVFFSISALLSL
jgi:hypothetical protein